MSMLFSFPEVVLATFALIDQTNMTKSFLVDSGGFRHAHSQHPRSQDPSVPAD